MYGQGGRNPNGVHIFSRTVGKRTTKGSRSNSWLLFVYTEGSKTPLPLFYVATCTTLFRDAAYLGAFIFNTSANSCWLGRLVIPQDTTCRPISRTKVLAITSTSIEGLAPPPRGQIHTYTHIYLYIYIGSIFQTLRGAMVAEPIASRMLLYTPCFSIPPLSRSRSRSTCGECSHGDYK